MGAELGPYAKYVKSLVPEEIHARTVSSYAHAGHRVASLPQYLLDKKTREAAWNPMHQQLLAGLRATKGVDPAKPGGVLVLMMKGGVAYIVSGNNRWAILHHVEGAEISDRVTVWWLEDDTPPAVARHAAPPHPVVLAVAGLLH